MRSTVPVHIYIEDKFHVVCYHLAVYSIELLAALVVLRVKTSWN
jgi:hypothetical protein